MDSLIAEFKPILQMYSIFGRGGGGGGGEEISIELKLIELSYFPLTAKCLMHSFKM